MGGDWTFKNTYFLILMSTSYIIGEIAHFLINTTGRAVALDIKFGDLACYKNTSFKTRPNDSSPDCHDFKSQSDCLAHDHCVWDYNGLGIQYQILAGPSWVAVYTSIAVIVGILADRFKVYGRNKFFSIGTILFSSSCLLMGIADQYWQLVVLRMGIAAGEAVCRPIASALIPDLFSPDSRGAANGIFSWGVYFGYGLAYVIGIYMTNANIFGYGWRTSYVISSIPGLILGFLLYFTVTDPARKGSYVQASADEDTVENIAHENEELDESNSPRESTETSNEGFARFLVRFVKSFFTLPMMLLLLAASVRQTSGFCWAYNTRPYFQTFYPDFDLGLWVFACSIFGGSFGVVMGGFASDRFAEKLGLHSRLWVLSASMLLAAPFALATLYFEPPYAFVALLLYYFCAETWFAILFTVIVEICPPEFKATSIALFLFIMTNIGGNLPVIVDPIGKIIGYAEAVYLFWPGFVALSGILFFVSSLPLWRRNSN